MQNIFSNINTKAQNLSDITNILSDKTDFGIFNTMIRLVIVVILIGVYWVVLDYARKSLKHIIPNFPKARLVVDLSITMTTILLSFMTVGIGFADNVGSFFTGIGLISTALVFTLQDFVASFFGWLHIKVGHLYATNDDITLHTNTSKYSGKVIHIGIFRTVIKVRRGDDGFDSEQPTGRTVSFPNHLVLKDSVDNSTLNNKILWHSINYTVVMESDAVFVKSLIKQVCEKQFQYSLDHNQIQDYSQNKKHIYKPKIYLDIAPEGKRFTIWFACNIGFYRDAVNGYSFDILEVFDRYNVQLAYPTQRLIVESPTMPKHVF